MTKLDSGYYEQLTVVIPVLNEENAIGPVIDEILSLGIPRDRILVVDGGSTDRSVDIALSRGVKVIRQMGEGKAMAIATALRHVDTEFILVMDGDYTYPARYIPVLLNAIKTQDCDLVIGSRVYGKESQKTLFKLGNRILTWVFNLLFGVRIRDLLSGMYIARRERLLDVGFEMKGFSVEAEIVSHFANLGRICEEPIEYRQRLDPKAKKLRILHGFYIARDIIRLTWRYNPAFLLFSIGSLLVIPGLLLGLWVLYRFIQYGFVHHIRGLAAIIITGVGLLSMISAIQSIHMKRIEQRIQRRLDQLTRIIQRIQKGE